MENVPDDSPVTRPPDTHDLLDICRKLNSQEAAYIVMGGMAVNIHGFAEDANSTRIRPSPEFWSMERK